MIILFAALILMLQDSASPLPKVMADDAALEGRWDLVTLNLDGEVQPKRDRRLLIYGPFWAELGEHGVSTWTIDRVATSPHPSFRRWLMRRSSPEPEACSSNRLGLYRLKGDELRFVYNLRDRQDPKGLEPAKGRGVEIYRRVAAAEPPEKFKGRWRLARMKRGDREVFADGRILAIDGDKWSEEIEGEKSLVAWKVTRGDGVPWPTIDIERRVITTQGTANNERLQGIYYLDGDSLIFAYGEKRPTTIHPGEGRVIESYRRIRPPDEEIIFIKPPDDSVTGRASDK